MSVKAGSNGAKKLEVVFTDGNIPKFSFIGNWIGKDVILVGNLIRRAYVKYNRNKRLEGIKKEEEK